MKKGYIYSLNCPISDIPKYIGCTTVSLNARYSRHLDDVSQNSAKIKWIQNLLSQGLAPKMELIDEVNPKEIFFWEKHYISLYKSWGFTLKNSTNGGEGSILSVKNLSKLNDKGSLIVLQYDLNGDFIKEWDNLEEINRCFFTSNDALLKACKNKTKLRRFFWQIKEENWSKKIEIGNQNRLIKKPILQYDLNGNFIREWDSVVEAQIEMTGSKIGSVNEAVNGVQKKAYDFMWTKKTNNYSLKINPYKKDNHSWKEGKRISPVLQFDLNDNFIKEWLCPNQIEEELGYKSSFIRQICRGDRKAGYGYKWKYKYLKNN